FPNARVERYYHLYDELLSLSGFSWWIIVLSDNPDVFYCNNAMCDMFNLDSSLVQHSVARTCPIAGDYNNNIAIQNNKVAQSVLHEFNQLRLSKQDEYFNMFPYYDERKMKYYFSLVEQKHWLEMSPVTLACYLA
ncbi:hypothetical protein, partial [Photobacterium sp. OFAV2-7]|uniref:hypothetical protein n=1 Tax=Photobacterium sp. OFAV2-7 TaxID=2917748 RepID=UPI001EF6E588